MLEIRLLGQFDVRQDGEPIERLSRPAMTLFAYLVLTRGTLHPREKLAGVLWPDSSESNARKNLRQALWQLRKAVGDSCLRVDPRSIGFNLDSESWLDIQVLESSSDQDLVEGVAAYAGELLPGYYEDWVLLQRDRLEATYERKMQRLLAQQTAKNRWMEVINLAEQWIARGNAPETGFRALLRAHAAMGERLKVEAAYRRCVGTLQQEIGVEPSEETTRLYRNLLVGLESSPDLPPQGFGTVVLPREQRANLPAQTTLFIGRKDELAAIEKLLSDTRLLTLTGPGGIGKTRLALKAAEASLPDFNHGVYFVALAATQSTSQFIQTISEAVKFPLATNEDPQYQLLRYLQKRQVLLVLDNFEHLLDAADIVDEILQSGPGVKILATSREKLNLKSETILNIGGLAFPTIEDSKNTLDYDAIMMFVQSARRVRPGFNPASSELKQIVKITHIVEGMPLAIELAASWHQLLTVDEIVGELEKGLDILSTEFRDAPARHRSIRAVFEHSWSFLDPAELDVFKDLSVFRGGFTREAAQQVSGASLPQLAGLVNKSFISRNPQTGRLEVHELLRQYAEEQLQDSPEESRAAKEAHAAYYASFMQQRWEDLKGSRQMAALEEIEEDIENIRAGWGFYLKQRNILGLWKFVYGLWYVYWIRWWNHTGMALFAEAAKDLQGVTDEEAVAFRALTSALQGYFMGWLDLADQGFVLAEESVEILVHLNHPMALGMAYDSLAVNSYFLNRYPENIEASNKMLQIAATLDDKWFLGFTLFAVGMGSLLEEDYPKARRIADENLGLFEEIGDELGTTLPLIVLGHAALACGEFKEAKRNYLRCLKRSEKTGFPYGLQTASKYLAKVTLSLGQINEADLYLQQSLRITNEIGFVRDIINLFYEFARLKAAKNNHEQAVELLAFVVQHPASAQARMMEGRIRDSAQTFLENIKGELPEEALDSAFARAEKLELEEIVETLLNPNHPE